MTQRKSRTLILSLAFTLMLGLVAAAAPAAERWFHVRVDEIDGAEVMVNLPLDLIESALRLIPAEVEEEVRLGLNDSDIDVEDLRQLWEEMRNGPDATYVTVREHDDTVEVRKEGDYFVAQTVERGGDGAEVNVRFPLAVIDALFSGENGRLDLAAAVRALAEHGDGDMVTVRDDETTVRVWVDDSNTSD